MSEETVTPSLLPKQGLLFSVNHFLFAIDLNTVKEVILPDLTYAPLPITPPYVKGLVLSRNTIYPVITLVQPKLEEVTEDARLILLTSETSASIALYADALHSIEPFPNDPPFHNHAIPEELQDVVTLCYQTSRGNVFYLELEKLYRHLKDQANQMDLA